MHLAQKNLAPVCRKLGVDYAPAMTGFSIRGGRSIPDIVGVVVCVEHADDVLRGFEDDQRCSSHPCKASVLLFGLIQAESKRMP